MAADRRIAVLGAGGAGACTALELAQRGYRVDVFEREEEALTQATFVCEGKVHLGLIYAKDHSLDTASLMISGALEFQDRMQRWIPFDAAAICSTPFHYCIHRGSLVDADALAHHYARCESRYDELAAQTRLDYLGLRSGSRTRRLEEAAFPLELDPEFFSAIFETTEVAVDPHGLFLSWYPTGRTGMSTRETPPDWHHLYTPEERMAIFESSFEEWARRCPALEKLPLDRDRIDPNGGVIYALGTTDVDDHESRLHDRSEIGIQSAGRYHSLDPGKFTLIPYWAMRMADRIDASG